MKYFTPELYIRFNSSDDAEADRADADWESAIRQYNQYLREHRSKMPANVRMLAEKCCFHDAALLGWQTHEPRTSAGSVSRRMLTIGLQQDTEIIVLHYFLSHAPKETKRRKNWSFSPERKHWLYDEVAVNQGSAAADSGYEFAHRVLWSDGSELEIPFVDVMVDRYPSLSPVTAQ